MDKVNDYGVGDVNFTTMMDTLDKTRIGIHKVSLTSFETSDVPDIAAGSVIEVNGAMYYNDSDEAITGSPSDGKVYIKIVPDGATASAEFTNTAPTWDAEKQGYYSPGVGEENERYLEFGMTKSGSNYSGKYTFGNLFGMEVLTGAGNWSPPAGVKKIKATLVGGGGAGGGTQSGAAGQSGTGGNAGSVKIYIIDIDAPYDGTMVFAYSVGAGGSGAADTAGTNGSVTTFTNGANVRTAEAGIGGGRRTPSMNNSNASLASDGYIIGVRGVPPSGGPIITGGYFISSPGGGNMFAPQSQSFIGNSLGQSGPNGIFPGGGGSGGLNFDGVAIAFSGGNGAAGTIIIEYNSSI